MAGDSRLSSVAARQRITDEGEAKGGPVPKIPSALQGSDGPTVTNEPILLFAKLPGVTNLQFNGPVLRTSVHQHQQRLRWKLPP